LHKGKLRTKSPILSCRVTSMDCGMAWGIKAPD
jgi:hypothetical protein